MKTPQVDSVKIETIIQQYNPFKYVVEPKEESGGLKNDGRYAFNREQLEKLVNDYHPFVKAHNEVLTNLIHLFNGVGHFLRGRNIAIYEKNHTDSLNDIPGDTQKVLQTAKNLKNNKGEKEEILGYKVVTEEESIKSFLDYISGAIQKINDVETPILEKGTSKWSNEKADELNKDLKKFYEKPEFSVECKREETRLMLQTHKSLVDNLWKFKVRSLVFNTTPEIVRCFNLEGQAEIYANDYFDSINRLKQYLEELPNDFESVYLDFDSTYDEYSVGNALRSYRYNIFKKFSPKLSKAQKEYLEDIKQNYHGIFRGLKKGWNYSDHLKLEKGFSLERDFTFILINQGLKNADNWEKIEPDIFQIERRSTMIRSGFIRANLGYFLGKQIKRGKEYLLDVRGE